MNTRRSRCELTNRRKAGEGGQAVEQKKIEKLYALLERAEKEHDAEAAAALKWAIFQLEASV